MKEVIQENAKLNEVPRARLIANTARPHPGMGTRTTPHGDNRDEWRPDTKGTGAGNILGNTLNISH